jgi:hypothetical protein
LASSDGLKTPFSVIIPVIRFAGVTSNAGFQQLIPVNIQSHVVFSAVYLDMHVCGNDKKCVERFGWNTQREEAI